MRRKPGRKGPLDRLEHKRRITLNWFVKQYDMIM